MSQSSATKLISNLRFKISDRRRLRNIEGPAGRHDKIKKIVTALFKHERIETTYTHGDESRGYAERLISDAIRYGDCHKPTMEMASYWIVEKPIIHKLFKVLAPRYKNFEISYTKMWRAPKIYPGNCYPKCILELRNNIYPPLGPDKSYNKNLIHNVLLEEAKNAYHKKKAAEAAAAAVVAGKANEMEKEVSADESNKSQIVETAQSEFSLNSGVDSDKMSETNLASEISSEESLKVENFSKDESNIKSESEFSSDIDLDLSKIKLEEEKPKETDTKDEKK